MAIPCSTLVAPKPHPLSMISRIPRTDAVCGKYHTTDLIHGGIPSRGQIMPVRSMCGKQLPIAILIASMDVLQIVERKKPKLMPAKPMKYECCQILRFGMLYTLKEGENYNPCNGSLTGKLEHSKYRDDGYSSLRRDYLRLFFLSQSYLHHQDYKLREHVRSKDLHWQNSCYP